MRSNTRPAVRLSALPLHDTASLVAELDDLHRRLALLSSVLADPQLRSAYSNLSIALDRAESHLRELRSIHLARSGALD